MHLPSAAAGTLVWALVALACRAPTAAPDEPSLVAPSSTALSVHLVVRSARDGHWLRPGDSVRVRITLEPDEEAARAGSVEGRISYDGVPLWAAAPAAPGAFATTYFTHDDVAGRVIGLFFGGDIARGRLLLLVRPDPVAVTWIITASGPDGEPVELARGDAAAP